MQENEHIGFFDCPLCSQIQDTELALAKVGSDSENTYLPLEIKKLQRFKRNEQDVADSPKVLQCPHCYTFYLYQSSYEYLINGSEVEESLKRLTPTESVEYILPVEYEARIRYFHSYLTDPDERKKSYSLCCMCFHYLYSDQISKIISLLEQQDSTCLHAIVNALYKAPIELLNSNKEPWLPLIRKQILASKGILREKFFHLYTRIKNEQSFTLCYYKKSHIFGKAVKEGNSILMLLEAKLFQGQEFDSMELLFPETYSDEEKKTFTFNQNCLCDCGFMWTIPVKMVVGAKEMTSNLECTLELGIPAPHGGISYEKLKLILKSGYLKPIETKLKSEHFSEALDEIQQKLGSKAYLRICYFCQYSDYHVAGGSLWGSMYCFRNQKQDYLQAITKEEYINVLRNCNARTYETDLCPEFLLREKP